MRILKYSIYTIFGVWFICLFNVSSPPAIYSDRLLSSLRGPVDYDDPELVNYIRNEVLNPPSRISNLKLNMKKLKLTNPSVSFYDKYIEAIFNDTGPGFFVEAGALDGVAMSNTLWLEKERNWTGLLVEPDPSNFKMLTTKNRKSWSAQSCLSVEKYPKVERLTSVDNTAGTDRNAYYDIRNRAMGSILRKDGRAISEMANNILNSYYSCQCFPLGSLLLALNVTKVDLLSLDVEFAEEPILRNFDFEKFDIKVLYIEYYDIGNKLSLHEFLISKNFIFLANLGADLVYVKRGSEYQHIADSKFPNRSLAVYVKPDGMQNIYY